MSAPAHHPHPVARRRGALNWTQAKLATRSGVPRTTVSAIEGGRLTPSVAAALALARALEATVEDLFSPGAGMDEAQWAWAPPSDHARFWRAEVGGRELLYPTESPAELPWSHDGVFPSGMSSERTTLDPSRTLVLAGCDPAAALLAAEYTSASGYRLLAFPRGGAAALDLLARGLVHVAALHRSTLQAPDRNAEAVRRLLGDGHLLLRMADWDAGIVLSKRLGATTVAACVKRARRWAAREPGTAARECLEDLLGKPIQRGRVWRTHAAVAEAVRQDHADAGVCVRLCAVEAGLRFLPLRTESLDLCFSAARSGDPRIQALIQLLRSRRERSRLSEMPGYDSTHTGELISV